MEQIDRNFTKTESNIENIKEGNPVISREYVEKNYIHKDVIRDLKKRIQKIYDDSPVDEFGIHDCQDTTWIENLLDEILEDK